MDEVVPAVPPRGAYDLRLDPAKHPGCTSGMERLPSPGEVVETIEGSATVVRVLGRTGSGGRLLELRMEDGRKAPFFAAAANVMVRPRTAEALGPAPSEMHDRPTPGSEGGESHTGVSEGRGSAVEDTGV